MTGTVVEVGAGVDDAWIGSRVFAMVAEGLKSSCYAEYVAIEADQLVPIPRTISTAGWYSPESPEACRPPSSPRHWSTRAR